MGVAEAEDFLARLRAEHAIREVLQHYVRANDRLQFDDLARAYHPDAYDDHGSYKGDIPGLVAWIADRHRTIEQSMHLTAAPLIELDGDAAYVETYCMLVQHQRNGCVDLATRLPAYCRFTFGLRYVDRFECRDGDWRIARRTVVWEWSQREAGTLSMDPSWVIAQRSRADTVYSAR
jgi:hypothetical protein